MRDASFILRTLAIIAMLDIRSVQAHCQLAWPYALHSQLNPATPEAVKGESSCFLPSPRFLYSPFVLPCVSRRKRTSASSAKKSTWIPRGTLLSLQLNTMKGSRLTDPHPIDYSMKSPLVTDGTYPCKVSNLDFSTLLGCNEPSLQKALLQKKSMITHLRRAEMSDSANKYTLHLD